MNISKNLLNSLIDSLPDFLKTSDKASQCLPVLLGKPNIEFGSTMLKNNLFAHYYKDIIEHIDIFALRSYWETTILPSFPPKKLRYRVIRTYLQKL